MVINRRQFGLGSLAVLGAGVLAMPANAAGAKFVGTAKAENGYVAAIFDGTGQILRQIPLEGRGHGLAISPDGRVLAVFARRPGFYIRLYDLVDFEVIKDIHPTQGRHFYGHGFFSPDGKTLFATENDYDGERGVLGLYDAGENYHRIGEYESGDIGPHEAILMQDRQTIAVANGGIATHPDFPRQKLNLWDMSPSLSYLDWQTGTIIEQVRLPQALHQLSIRHLAEGPDQTIWFAGQFQGSRQHIVDIVGYHKRGMAEPSMVKLDEALSARLQNYGGSVSCNLQTGKVAITSPRGGVMMVFDGYAHKLERVLESADICAISPQGSSFMAATGRGQIINTSKKVLRETNLKWDNHSLSYMTNL